jgi:SAM-dependent methyltransferase
MTKLYSEYAELYDIAFDWDLTDEVDWLLERLGSDVRDVLEPGCGSGRLLDALAWRDLRVTGIDSSPEMVALARHRLRGRGLVHLADMTAFNLGRRFDAAVSPINTLLHLAPEALQRHLQAMADHLQAGARYLVQVGLVDPNGRGNFAASHWEAERGGTKLRIDWVDEELDVERGRSRQRSRIEILAGAHAGEVIEEIHEMTAWTPATWHTAIDASPFTEVATYDGAQDAWPRVALSATGGLLWHELVPSP